MRAGRSLAPAVLLLVYSGKPAPEGAGLPLQSLFKMETT